MGVKPVEYKRDSSTQGFAVAGDKKDITKTTANTIKKDVDQGNTEDLDNGQERCLENYIDYDNIEYTEDENKNVGRNQIDTSKAKGINGGNATGTMVGSAASTAAGAGVMFGKEFGQEAIKTMTKQTTQQVVKETVKEGGKEVTKETTKEVSKEVSQNVSSFSDIAKAGKATEKTSKIPWAAVIAGAIATAGGAMALASALGFDPQYKDRTSQRDSAEETNQIIQQYYDELTANMDSMSEESTKYAELCELQLQSDVSLIDQIGELQAQIIEYRAQGNEAKVAELQKQIEELQKGAAEDTGNRDEMGAIKGNLELYASRNAEAQGVSESGDIVSTFLQDGNTLGVLGYVQAALMTVGALLMLKSTFNAIKAATKVPGIFAGWAMIIAMAGCVLMVAGNAMTAGAAYKMFNKASNEMKCGKAGDQMAEYVASLNENIDAQAGYTEETGAGYVEADGAAAEEVTKTQEGVDKANTQLAKSVGGNNENGGNPPTSPDGGSGNGVGGDTPDDKPDNNQPDGGNNPTT